MIHKVFGSVFSTFFRARRHVETAWLQINQPYRLDCFQTQVPTGTG